MREAPDRPLAENTLSIWKSALKGLHDELRVHAGARSNPWAHSSVKLKKGYSTPANPPRVMSDKEAEKMINAPDRGTMWGMRDYAVMCLLFGAGLRKDEVLRVEVGDIRSQNEETYVHVSRAKNGKDRDVNVADWAAEGLWDWARLVGEGRLVVSKLETAGMSPSGLHVLFKRYLVKCGLDGKGYTIHSTRKTSATRLLDQGETPRDVQRFLGHEDSRSIKAYDDLRVSRTRGAGANLTFGRIGSDTTHRRSR